jgi:tricarballylate dehydrogenase
MLDGRRTAGLGVNKSNWAQTIDVPPFTAFGVTCGITFTFGGLRINRDAQVISVGGRPIESLYAAGELVGGLHYFNYAGGTGLTGGTVFGRRAGYNAAARAAARAVTTA